MPNQRRDPSRGGNVVASAHLAHHQGRPKTNRCRGTPSRRCEPPSLVDVEAIAAVIGVATILGLVVFQAALASGAPWGEYAWGGTHSGVLPRRFRIASACSIPVYALIALIFLDAAGMVDVMTTAVTAVALWCLVGVFSLGVLMNAASRSAKERSVFTPVVAVLLVVSLLLALNS